MPSQRSRKVVKLLGIVGLPVLLLLAVVATPLIMYLFVNNKANPINQLTIALSKWRKLRKYLIAQAKLESGNFKSNIYRKTNNPLAMGHAIKRKQLGDPSPSGIFEGDGGSGLNIQKYRNDTQGFRDMFLWYAYGNFPTSVTTAQEYVRELKKRKYFSLNEQDYLDGLQSYL